MPFIHERKLVVKRDGRKEPWDIIKITNRITKLAEGIPMNDMSASVEVNGNHTGIKSSPLPNIDVGLISQKVVADLTNEVSTREIDANTARIAMQMSLTHPDYAVLASRLIVNDHHKNTRHVRLDGAICSHTFLNIMKTLHRQVVNDIRAPIISDKFLAFVEKNAESIHRLIDYSRDYELDYIGMSMMLKQYLLRMTIMDKEVLIERPQDTFMRSAIVASIGVNYDPTKVEPSDDANIRIFKNIAATYDYLSWRLFTHATPTLLNAGRPRQQLASCFLLGTEDSTEGLMHTVSNSSHISRYAGGIGLNVSNVRARGSPVRGTGGYSQGIIPMAHLLQWNMKWFNQGAGKRPGSMALYMEPWHADIMDFLRAKRPKTAPDFRVPDLYYALWIPDKFMRAVEANEDWYLMCPDKCPGLCDVYGKWFDELYDQYVAEGRYSQIVKARELFKEIVQSEITTGMPYIAFKDHANSKNNQANLGTIKCSNLCCEIYEYSNSSEYAVCNLASVCLQRFVVSESEDSSGLTQPTYDFDKLRAVIRQMTINLNNIIDANYYPVPETKVSNMRHRPIGIGVQGLADALIALRIPFDSPEARVFNAQVMENIYFASMSASCDLAEMHGPYESYSAGSAKNPDGSVAKWGDSPISQGLFQFDLWDGNPSSSEITLTLEDNWNELRKRIQNVGVRNSLCVALMPTASTSLLLGSTECFEPITSILYNRKTGSGNFRVINEAFIRDMCDRGLWTKEVIDAVTENRGSVQGIDAVPKDLQELYKTAWEMPASAIIDAAAARGPFVDQSQSMNIYIAEPTGKNIYETYMRSWKSGLKTGQYYLRMQPAGTGANVSARLQPGKKVSPPEIDGPVCTMQEGCVTCSS